MTKVSRSEYAQALTTFKLPRYEEIPTLDLYMDQLLGYLEDALRPLYHEDEKIITSSMVNNYVKQGLLAKTATKRYSRDHVAYLIVICALKQTFSIAEIVSLIRAQINSFDIAVAYNYFCETFEGALHSLFSEEAGQTKALISTETKGDFERNLVLGTTSAVAYTLFIKECVHLVDAEG